MVTTKPQGTIITFYSYKGGTGRSMALSNVAWVLASNGKRVLTVDWDLEAPGLHRYFHPFMVDKELTSSEGLIDFVLKFVEAAATPQPLLVYLAQPESTLLQDREGVREVLVKKGCAVLPDAPLPTNLAELESTVRGYLAKCTMAVHLVGDPQSEAESYPYVYKQIKLAAERSHVPGFSQIVWMPPHSESPGTNLPVSKALQGTDVLQVSLDELKRLISKRITHQENEWYVPYANILRYASSLDWKFAGQNGIMDGTLDLIPAGRQSASYSTRVNSFNWQNFYDQLGGGILIEKAKDKMRAEYDFILIDSRTGVSDTSGICTVQMPDILVICFTLNNQSIEGASAVAQSIQAQRPKLRIFPVPMRVEKFEKERLDLAREAMRLKFDQFLRHLTEEAKAKYWGDVEIFYEPYYAYEEMLATFGDKPHRTNSLLASIERITGYLTNNQINQVVPPSESERVSVKAKYERQMKPKEVITKTSQATDYYFYLSHSPVDDVVMIQKFYNDLSNQVRLQLGFEPSQRIGFFDHSVSPDEVFSDSPASGLENSRVLVALYSPAYFNNEECGKQFEYFIDRMKTIDPNGHVQLILPVTWIPSVGALPTVTAQLETFSPKGGLRQLMKSPTRSDQYAKLLEDIALRLVNLALQVPPSSNTKQPYSTSVSNAFAESNLSKGSVQLINFMYVVGRNEEVNKVRENVSSYGDTGDQWRPFAGNEANIQQLSFTIAADEKLTPEILPIQSNITSLVQECEQNNIPVILIVDAWTLRLPQYNVILKNFNRDSVINCGVMVVSNDRDRETIRDRDKLTRSLRETFPLGKAEASSLLVEVGSEEEFRDDLLYFLKELRKRLSARTRAR